MLRKIVKYFFGATGRREAKRLKKYSRDYSQSQILQNQFQLTKKADIVGTNLEVPLSQAINGVAQKSPYKHFTKPHPKQIKRFLRANFKRSINQNWPATLNAESVTLEDKTLKWKENMIMYDEAKKFKKIVFKKEETERLVLLEQIRPQNYLPIEYLQEKGETEYEMLHKQQMKFSETINQLQTQRIDRLIQRLLPEKKQTSPPEDIYGLLIKSQILNLGPEVHNIINLQINWITNQRKQTTDVQQRNIVVMDQNEELVTELTQEILSKFDQNNESIDMEALKQFYREFLNFDVEKKFEMQKHLQSINEIQNYQTFLFDKFRNQDINFRYKDQRLQFWMLTQEETLGYIKYNIQNEEILLRMVDTLNQYPEKKSIISAQLVQKLSTFRQPLVEQLKIIGDNRFRILIRNMVEGLGELDDNYFASSILAITVLNPKAIIQVYPRLGVHLQKKILVGLLKRLDNLSTDCLAMMLRNLHNLPFSKSALLQGKLMSKIEALDATTLYQVESFLQFSTFVYKDLQLKHEDSQLKLLEKLSNFVTEFQFDQTTTMIAVRSLTALAFSGRVDEVSTLIDHFTPKLQYCIKKMHSDKLSQVVLLLSLIPTKKELVKECKKRMIIILNYKEKIQDQKDIAIIAASLAKIDTRKLYDQKLNFHEINLLQCIYARSVFGPKSTQYIPFSKLLKQITTDLKSFSTHSLSMVVQAYGALNYQNKLAIVDLVSQGVGYDQNKFYEQELTPLSLDKLGIFFYAFTSMNMKTELLRKLIDHFENLYLQSKDEAANAVALSLYSMSLFHTFYQDLNETQLNMQVLYLTTQLSPYMTHISPTIKISLFFSLLASIFSKKFQIQDSGLALSLLLEHINSIQISNILLEHRYILTLCQLMLENLKLGIKISPDLLITTQTFLDLFSYQEKITTKYLEQMGTERYSPEEVCQLLEKDLEKLNIQFQKSQVLVYNSNPFEKVEFLLPVQKIAIKFLSYSQLIEQQDGENIKFSYTGKQLLLRQLSKELLGIKIVYIVIEQYNRVTEQIKLDPQATINFLKQQL